MKQLLLQFIKLGASLPVGLKGGVLEKVLRRVLNVYKNSKGKDATVRSNLGLNKNLKVDLPVLQAPTFLLFGTPESYTGEFYTVQLSGLLTKHCAAFVDIGANWGFYSYYIATTNPGKPIFWFEPNPFLHNNIRENLSNNKLQHVKGSDMALSDKNGTLTFYLNPESDLISSIVAPKNENGVIKQTVATTRFDNWASDPAVPSKLMVKVDVENAEWEFIRGAVNAIDKIEYLVMEVLGPARQSGFINYTINDLKLQAYYINKNRIEHVKAEDMRYNEGEFNWLFCKQSPRELREKLPGSIFEVID
jgi:FkbM family methyltransferase